MAGRQRIVSFRMIEDLAIFLGGNALTFSILDFSQNSLQEILFSAFLHLGHSTSQSPASSRLHFIHFKFRIQLKLELEPHRVHHGDQS